jgi:hypothetical protein
MSSQERRKPRNPAGLEFRVELGQSPNPNSNPNPNKKQPQPAAYCAAECPAAQPPSSPLATMADDHHNKGNDHMVTAQVRSTVRRRVPPPKPFCPPTRTGYASATQQEADKENRIVRAEEKARKARDAERLRELAGERLRCGLAPQEDEFGLPINPFATQATQADTIGDDDDDDDDDVNDDDDDYENSPQKRPWTSSVSSSTTTTTTTTKKAFTSPEKKKRRGGNRFGVFEVRSRVMLCNESDV